MREERAGSFVVERGAESTGRRFGGELLGSFPLFSFFVEQALSLFSEDGHCISAFSFVGFTPTSTTCGQNENFARARILMGLWCGTSWCLHP